MIAYAKKLKQLMNIIIYMHKQKCIFKKVGTKLTFILYNTILLSDQNSQNGTIIVLTVTFVLVIMDEVFIYQYIVNNNTFILLVFWLQMMLPLNTLSHDTLVRFCFFPCIEL